MGIIYKTYLDNSQSKIYTCLSCNNHLAEHNSLISKDFHGLRGEAYLFDNVVNIMISNDTIQKIMTTGRHSISIVSCISCKEALGWKYIKAFEEDQKYKEGKYILERSGIQSVYNFC